LQAVHPISQVQIKGLLKTVTLADLKSTLERAAIPEIAYSFASDGVGEVYRISYFRDRLGDGWEVYYSERGNKNDLLIHRSESDACEDLHRRLIREFCR
jgi:hypothetical protein